MTCVEDATPAVILKTFGNQRIAEVRDSSLRVGRFGVRISMGTRFAAIIQTDTEAQTASLIRGVGSLPTGKSGRGCGVKHPTPFNGEVEKRVASTAGRFKL